MPTGFLSRHQIDDLENFPWYFVFGTTERPFVSGNQFVP
jgi:hypothetical protein